MTFTPAARKLVEQAQPYPPVPAPRAAHTPLYYSTRSRVRRTVKALRGERTRTVVRVAFVLGAASGIVACWWVALIVAALWS